MFKGIFIADLHCSKQRKEDCLNVLNQIWHFVKENKVPLFICGDFWDSTITATTNSGYTEFVDALNDIIKITDVHILMGTPTHEVEGSNDVFELLGAKVYRYNEYFKYDDFELITLPEPRKSHYITECGTTEGLNEFIVNKIDSFVKSVPPKSDLPRICIFHNEIVGDKMVNGADCVSPIGLRPSWLKELNCDILVGGHIHKAEKVTGIKNCYYVGSAPCKNWDEKHDASFMYVEI